MVLDFERLKEIGAEVIVGENLLVVKREDGRVIPPAAR
jgi:hypothetical protein